jgi:hypothetical protein
MTNDFKKGDFIAIQFLERKKLKSELWKFLSYNKFIKEYWFYSDDKVMKFIKEKNIIDIIKTDIPTTKILHVIKPKKQ